MSGGFRGGAHHVRRSISETPLIKLVEDYLYEFKHLSFINLDHMGEIIKRKSFRYARLKPSVFKDQLRDAYQRYSESASQNLDEFSGANIEMDDTPLTDETLKQMEGFPDSDSDLEIDESACVKRDAGVNQMKNLYMGSTSSNLGNTNESTDKNETTDHRKGLPSQDKMPNQLNNRNLDRVDCVSVGSSTDLSNKSENMRTKTVISAQQKVPSHSEVNNGDESGSDLEIIEEVPHERPQNSVITNGSARLSHSVVNAPRGNSMDSQKASASPTNTTIGKKGSTIVSDDSRNAPKSINTELQTRDTKNSEAPTRGIKRKQFSYSKSEGINDDLSAKRPRKEMAVIQDTGYKLQDFAGSDKVVEEICKLLMHLKHPEVYQTLGVTPPRGFLLHGPPGTGKTLLANSIAGELQTPMLKIAGTELVSGISGESESNIRELFNQAVAIAPCIIFIDEIDSVTPRRENVNKEMERRIVAQLLACIDDLGNKENGNQVLLIGATNRIEAIDTALRRAGRFDREICLGIPDEKSREKILAVICRDLKLEPGFDIKDVARLTPGYVGADLQALIREAAVQAVNRKLLSENTESSVVAETSAEAMDVDTEPASSDAIESQPMKDPANKISENQSEEAQGIAKPDEEKPASTEEVESSEIVDLKNSSATKLEVVEITTTVDGKPALMEAGTVASSEVKDFVELRNQEKGAQSIPTSVQKILPLPNPVRWIKEAAPLNPDQLQDLFVTMADFTFALKNVQPSSKREGFATVPDTTWEDIGALQNIRDELQVSILGPVKHAEAFKKLGLTTPAGVLLCGPPGCGKTLLAKAVANEAGINFISVKGPELLNMYVGESERAVRQCFLRARNSSPCVIFFDELDALCPRRSDVADGGSSGRIVNQLLTEMDGIESRQGVYVMAASNRPDIIDPAVLRPGRLDKVLFVNLPTSNERHEILKALTKNSTRPLLSDDVNLEEIANCQECEDYTGADLAALIREASIAAFRELVLNAPNDIEDSSSSNELKVHMRHFTTAFQKTKPSVGKDERQKYKLMAEKYSSIR